MLPRAAPDAIDQLMTEGTDLLGGYVASLVDVPRLAMST